MIPNDFSIWNFYLWSIYISMTWWKTVYGNQLSFQSDECCFVITIDYRPMSAFHNHSFFKNLSVTGLTFFLEPPGCVINNELVLDADHDEIVLIAWSIPLQYLISNKYISIPSLYSPFFCPTKTNNLHSMYSVWESQKQKNNRHGVCVCVSRKEKGLFHWLFVLFLSNQPCGILSFSWFLSFFCFVVFWWLSKFS